MSVPHPEIFKAYDIRGIVGQSLTPDIVEQIGRAIGTEALAAGDNAVIVGRDGRLSGPAIASVLMDGICATGCHTVDIGMVPTPLTYFATQTLEIGSAVSVTGSHNPPDYNGLKVMIGTHTLAAERIQDLRKRIEVQDFSVGVGERSSQDVVPRYVDRVVGDIRMKRPLRVVTDCGNGVAGMAAPQLMRDIGCDVIELFSEVDGTFPNHHPDPSVAENLAPLIEAVLREQADLGLAFDGDGDRLGVVTDTGQVIWPDRQMILFARDILSRNPGAKIIYDVKCTRLLPEAVEQAGGEALMWKTGHSFIKAKLRETCGALGGEMSGHLFFKERWYGFDDALYAAARLCEVLSNDSRLPSAVFAEIPDTVNTPELRIEMQEGEHHALIKELVAHGDFSGGEICNIDGVRVDFEDGFGLARASNTTPTVILRFEADTEPALRRIQNLYREQILALRPELTLPF
ncbi:MAG: phosphomannomutase/phosphoglucomutase [Acidiferrobacteraceae bacterium]|jgi:phosphomannomutase/phosphoglucomutase|nr:phosphomannomutase/phosphoglucomutase [Acidiferrobacteraceae bacterium]MDP6397623.1 phosphomannomutase/phosphoglucomutase [Arenicellales bacterium]MDP6551489.1 phosphomannomutase/phosphoglucomutase [Arenicellales bacterium]MDP6790441.1 phosphomannomutase/phosphoglucomutase [Arenicellales bacterium]MDP6917680.1 phosphomannomutase/phosphoglucomutase [Arenicellales bacterium]|tara:strand:+ start:422 stop:1798 length:1377 start_codon:yes stop_codon:yes gene_type:complete